MSDHDIERRLRAVMQNEVERVDPHRVADRLPASSLGEYSPAKTTRQRIATPLLAAAAVAAVATGAVLLGGHGHEEAAASAGGADQGRTAAASASGSVTYVRVSDGVARDQIETWIPADRSQTWQLNQANFADTEFAQQRARCAAFPYMRAGMKTAVIDRKPVVLEQGHVPGCHQGNWSYPRPAFYEALSDDPAVVLASLRDDRHGNDAETFATGYDALGAGWVQPAAVKKIVAALKLLPETTTTRDGRTETLGFAGTIKPGVVEHWSITLDLDAGRAVRTSFYYGDTAPQTNTITYENVDRLGER